jgi:hypothetical protein
MARIYALLGDADHAIPILKRLLHISYLVPLTPATASQPCIGSNQQRSSFSGVDRRKDAVNSREICASTFIKAIAGD